MMLSDYDEDAADVLETELISRHEKLGFRPQKEIPWNRYLPYADVLDDESQQMLNNIKENLAKAVAMRDLNPGVGIYATRLMVYIKLYGLKFSKEDHIKFIKLFIELTTLPDLEPSKLNRLCIVLLQLFKKPNWLSPDDLQIEWRPFYLLFQIYLHKSSTKGNHYQFFSKAYQTMYRKRIFSYHKQSRKICTPKSLGIVVPINLSHFSKFDLENVIKVVDYMSSLQNNLKLVIKHCSVYFPKESTKEILDEILPKLQPLDTGKSCQVFEILYLFLNFYHGYELWFDDFINLWNTYQNPPWADDMMNILANLAFENIGKIDWEPYLPIMFTRILRAVDLPVSYKHLKGSRNQNLCAHSISKWIIATLGPNTSGQKYLNMFMGAIESYLHPANTGKWTKVLGQILVGLPEYFSKRLEFERFRKTFWMDQVPDPYKLTDNCVTEFVENLKSAAFQTMYSRIDHNDVYKIFRHLSNLRPELIVPGVLDRVYANLESLTEPHRLTASLQCLVGISRSLICGHNGYTAGRTHVIPILFAVLPGIDPNDLRKALLTMNFYGAFVFQIPIVDCSTAGQYYSDLTEEESLICEQTADFENFVLQFIDRLFVMIKFSTQESIRMEQSNTDSNKSKYDMIVENAISHGLQVILAQSSDEILMSSSKKITSFVQSNLLEPHVAAPLLGTLVQSVATIAGNNTFKTLVPYLTDRLNKYLTEHEDAADVEKQSDDFLYHFTILYAVFKGDPRQVLKYLDDYLIPIIDATIKFKCKLTTKITSNILFHLMFNLSRMQIIDTKDSDFSSKKPLSEYLPIRHWGKNMGPNEKLDWYIPDETSRKSCENLIHRYLPPILETFENHINDTVTISRDDVLKNANFLLSLIGLSNFLPNWSEEPKDLYDSVVDSIPCKITLGFEGKEICMPDGTNVRLAIINTIGKLQDKILATSDDDIKSLKAIISIWERVHMRKAYLSSFDTELKSYNHLKQFQEFKLVKHKRNIKAVVVKRVLIQQICRDEQSTAYFTESHKKIMLKLLKLATSHYSAVRSLSQMKLFQIIYSYAYSYKQILDDIVQYLQLDSNEHHETFKGALYMLLGSGRTKLLVKNDWYCVEKLWISVLKSMPSEKPSIVHLLDAIIYVISDEFTTLAIEIEIPDKIVDLGLALIEGKNMENMDKNIEIGKQRLAKSNQENRERYFRIIELILEILHNNSLHWRYHLMGSTMIHILVHPKTKYPLSVAEYFVQNLVNESIRERKTATRVINSVLVQNKKKHEKLKVDPFEIAGVSKPNEKKLPFGLREDNRWLQYKEETLPKNQEDWDKPDFTHKTNGFFGWSSDFQVYAPYKDQPKFERTVDEMSEIEKVFYNFFTNKDNVEKFISFWSLEENKGKEKFKQTRFYIFKNLFKIFGDAFFDNFHPHLERLIKENKLESNHRCASEILAGIMRGMKHWPYDMSEKMYDKLKPLIRLALENITVETDDFWGTCFATASEHIDPRKQYWLHEVLIEEPLRESTSFIDCCRIFCLQGTFNQHVWRMDSYAQRLLDYLRPFLNHSFQNVRTRLGSILINIFEADLQFAGGNPPECPRIKDMIHEVVQKIQCLSKDMPAVAPVTGGSEIKVVSPEQKEYDESVRLFKTICQWLIGVISRNTNGNELSYFDLLPFACRLESNEQDSELADTSTTLLAMIAQALTLPDKMGYALEKISEVSQSQSWGARMAVIDALQVMVFHNMGIVSSRDEWVQQVQNIVLRLLEDTSIEVREKTAQVLGGLLHCSFLPATDKLLAQFKQKCKTKVVRSNGNRRPIVSCAIEAPKNDIPLATVESQEAEAVRLRHTGVLGLCAFISAYPYDVPDFVPDVFQHLGNHLNDPQPIPSTIRKTVGDFKRTHHDNWATHQLKFTEDQLEVLSDLTIPPSYYS